VIHTLYNCSLVLRAYILTPRQYQISDCNNYYNL